VHQLLTLRRDRWPAKPRKAFDLTAAPPLWSDPRHAHVAQDDDTSPPEALCAENAQQGVRADPHAIDMAFR